MGPVSPLPTFESCHQVSDALIDAAFAETASEGGASPRAKVGRLLREMAAVSAPKSGAVRILQVLARIADAPWVAGTLEVRLLNEGSRTLVETQAHLAGSSVDVFEPLSLNAPYREFSKALASQPNLMAPLKRLPGNQAQGLRLRAQSKAMRSRLNAALQELEAARPAPLSRRKRSTEPEGEMAAELDTPPPLTRRPTAPATPRRAGAPPLTQRPPGSAAVRRRSNPNIFAATRVAYRPRASLLELEQTPVMPPVERTPLRRRSYPVLPRQPHLSASERQEMASYARKETVQQMQAVVPPEAYRPSDSVPPRRAPAKRPPRKIEPVFPKPARPVRPNQAAVQKPTVQMAAVTPDMIRAFEEKRKSEGKLVVAKEQPGAPPTGDIDDSWD